MGSQRVGHNWATFTTTTMRLKLTQALAIPSCSSSQLKFMLSVYYHIFIYSPAHCSATISLLNLSYWGHQWPPSLLMGAIWWTIAFWDPLITLKTFLPRLSSMLILPRWAPSTFIIVSWMSSTVPETTGPQHFSWMKELANAFIHSVPLILCTKTEALKKAHGLPKAVQLIIGRNSIWPYVF